MSESFGSNIPVDKVTLVHVDGKPTYIKPVQFKIDSSCYDCVFSAARDWKAKHRTVTRNGSPIDMECQQIACSPHQRKDEDSVMFVEA